MQLNLPIIDQLSSCRNVLIAGMGGGFDIFCGLPIYLELRRRGQTVHLANLTFSDILDNSAGTRLTDTLVGVAADYPGIFVYFPELFLSRWLREQRGEEATIWCFQKTGAIPLMANYRTLVDHLGVDGILLIDGGVDSLMHANEHEMGTLVEDTLSLLAVNDLIDVPTRLLGCLGFGAEQDIAYAQVIENIATLASEGAFLGSCSLTQQMEVYQEYEAAVLYTHNQPFHDSSVINASIISAVRGHYGNYHLTEKTQGSRLSITPLMSIYWFFDLPAVARHNMLLSQLRMTTSFQGALRVFADTLRFIKRRPPSRTPLL